VPLATSAGLTFHYDVQATDSDGDPLTYAITQNPGGMTIDSATGRIAWPTTAANIGNMLNPLLITVTDSHRHDCLR
jgi:putative Ig domain-containing protein